MRTHTLKTLPSFYAAIIDGSKTFEVRNNDLCLSGCLPKALRVVSGACQSPPNANQPTRSVPELPGPPFSLPRLGYRRQDSRRSTISHRSASCTS